MSEDITMRHAIDPARIVPALIVQAQLDAYNARDLERFAATYSDDIRIWRMPASEPATRRLGAILCRNRQGRPASRSRGERLRWRWQRAGIPVYRIFRLRPGAGTATAATKTTAAAGPSTTRPGTTGTP